MRRAVFLDRDGVLNQTVFRLGKPRAPYTMDEFVLFPGVIEAIKDLKKRGFLIIVVTNQPDVARGWVSREAVDEVNQRLGELILPDALKVCFHTEKDNCFCRKPKPGMLLEAAREWQIDLPRSFMVGDRYSDVEAGKSAGTRTILIGEGDAPGNILPDFRCGSLWDAVRSGPLGN